MNPIEIPKAVWDFETVKPFIPSSGWIRNYVAYAIQCTDAPPLYHIMAATAVVASAVAPQVDLNVFDELHPLHMFLLMVGNSGTRKSAAINRCIRVVRPAYTRLSFEHRLWWPESCSVEGLIDNLAVDANRLLIAGEWSELHNQAKSSYWKHAGEFWNLVYDAMPLQRVRAGQQIQVSDPRVCILGASTPSLVKGATDAHDWAAGKIARYLICCAEKPDDMYMEAARDLPREAGILSLEFERFFSAPLNAFTLSAAAWELLQQWKQSREWATTKKKLRADHLEPALNRVDEHVLRLAAIYQASITYPFEHVVQEDAMHAAIQFVWHCIESMCATFDTLPVQDRVPLSRARAVLTSVGAQGVPRSTFLRRTHLTSIQLNQVVATLVESEELRIEKRGTNTYYCAR